MAFYCGHIKINNNSFHYYLIKGSCEICDGFLLCKEHLCKNDNSWRISDNITQKYSEASNIIGYIEKSKCEECKQKREKNIIKRLENICSHNIDYDTCSECEKNCEIVNGCCKHTCYSKNNIVYCKLCEKERGGHWKELYIKNNNKYICECSTFNYYDGQSYGQNSINNGLYHEKCKFYVCKHDIIYYDECMECKNELIIENKCKHNKRSICKACRKYNEACGITNICIHNNNINKCVECGFIDICSHNKIFSECYECDRFHCRHNKLKTNCKICGGSNLCQSIWCETFGNKKYNGYCLRCYINLFPDQPNTRNYKTKEKDVVDRVIQKFPNFVWIADKKIEGGCSKRRPDLLLDYGSHIIIIEVDENKHTDYDCSCENKRLMEISKDLEHRPIVFIRFNPDNYIDKNGKKIQSCWKINKLGIMCITKKEEWVSRINCLLDQIQYWMDNPTEKTIEIIQLYY